MKEEEILVFPGIKENNNALMFYKLCILLVNSLTYFANKFMILIEKNEISPKNKPKFDY